MIDIGIVCLYWCFMLDCVKYVSSGVTTKYIPLVYHYVSRLCDTNYIHIPENAQLKGRLYVYRSGDIGIWTARKQLLANCVRWRHFLTCSHHIRGAIDCVITLQIASSLTQGAPWSDTETSLPFLHPTSIWLVRAHLREKHSFVV
jgi:hypothetical protein